MRKSFIAGNWKMNKTVAESLSFLAKLKPLVKDNDTVDIAICPTFLAVESMANQAKDSNIMIGGQNLFWEDSGAYTGEISAPMLKAVGAKWVIIGHSERRQYFGETNETVNQRIKAALNHQLPVIMCVGETLEQRESEETFKVIKEQLHAGLQDISADAGQLVIAYEPVWAIGTGKTATGEQAQEVHAFIRGELASIFNSEVANAIRIQYGGSVKPANVRELMAKPDIDGALVGGASLQAESFAQLVNYQ